MEWNDVYIPKLQQRDETVFVKYCVWKSSINLLIDAPGYSDSDIIKASHMRGVHAQKNSSLSFMTLLTANIHQNN